MGTETNIFEQATRLNLMFPSNKGILTIQQLWDLPLTSKSGFDLDTIAKAVNKEVKTSSEESFVKPLVNTDAQNRAELALAILKRVIEVKLADADAAKKKEANRQERVKLLEILSGKKDAALLALPIEEIEKKLAALDG